MVETEHHHANFGGMNPLDEPDLETIYNVADLFKVFSDTTRIRILYALMDGELCVADIAEAVEMSQSAVSHQLRILRQSHLVKFRKEGKQMYYSLSDDHVFTIIEQGTNHVREYIGWRL